MCTGSKSKYISDTATRIELYEISIIIKTYIDYTSTV